MMVMGRISLFKVTLGIILVLSLTGFSPLRAQAAEELESAPTAESSAAMLTDSSPAPLPVEELKGPPAPPPEDIPEEQPRINACANLEVSGVTWLDQTHDFVERNSCQPSVWFDNFFGDKRVLEDVRPGTFVRLRNAAQWVEGEGVQPVLDYHIRWQLPQLKSALKRVRIYLDSGDEEEKYSTGIDPPVNPKVKSTTRSKKPVLGVQADLYSELRSLVRFNTGVRFNIHPDAFVQMRYQYSNSFRELYLIRLSQRARWSAVDYFTDTSQLDFERILTTFTLLRWANNVTYAEGVSGITWNTGISYIAQLTPKSAISCDTSMWGANSPGWEIENYRIGTKYRRNFLRPWLFYELEPEITWPKDDRGKRQATLAFMAVFEIQFGQ